MISETPNCTFWPGTGGEAAARPLDAQVFDLADAIITVRRLVREAWTLYRWDGRPPKRS